MSFLPPVKKNHQPVVLLHSAYLKENIKVKILVLGPVSDRHSYDKSMHRNLKLVMSLKIKESSCKNECFPIFGVYHFVVDFSHPEMFIV